MTIGKSQIQPSRGRNPISKVQSSLEAEVLESLAKVIGIDKLWLTAPLRSFDQDRQSWSIVKANGGLEVPVQSSTASLVYVRVFQDQAVPWGMFQFNPSRFVDPDGCGLASISSIPRCISEAMTLASRVVEMDSDVQLARVKRVDITRDFSEVEHMAKLIKGFVSHPGPNARFITHFLGANGVVQGLETGSKSGGKVLLYDKFIQSRGMVTQGTLRYEAQCRAWAAQAGIEYVRDLTEDNLARLAWDRWHWAGFGSYVTGAPEMLELVNRSDHPESVKRKLKGNILLELHGELGHLASATRSSYRKQLRELGILPSGVMDAERSRMVHSLNLVDGTAKVFSFADGEIA